MGNVSYVHLCDNSSKQNIFSSDYSQCYIVMYQYLKMLKYSTIVQNICMVGVFCRLNIPSVFFVKNTMWNRSLSGEYDLYLIFYFTDKSINSGHTMQCHVKNN